MLMLICLTTSCSLLKSVVVSDYCEVSFPIYIEDELVRDCVLNDPDLSNAIKLHNKNYEDICSAG